MFKKKQFIVNFICSIVHIVSDLNMNIVYVYIVDLV